MTRNLPLWVCEYLGNLTICGGGCRTGLGVTSLFVWMNLAVTAALK